MGFDVTWKVVQKDTGAVVAEAEAFNYTCRDSAFYALTRKITQAFMRTIGIDEVPGNGTRFYAAWHNWTRTYAKNALTLEATFGMIPVDQVRESSWTRVYRSKDTDRMTSVAIPQIIDTLAPLYPTVTFTPFSHVDVFANTQRHGIKLKGDISVIPAFYWSGYFQRAAAYTSEMPENTEKLIASYDNDHRNAWNRLKRGEEPSGAVMLALEVGPVLSFNMRHDLRDAEVYKNDPWFAITDLK